MRVEAIKVGPIATNCYLAWDETTKEALILDPGDEASKILADIKKLQLKPKFIVSTHGHFDHITAIPELKKKLNIPYLANPADDMIVKATTVLSADQELKEGDGFEVGSLKFEVLATPGHTPGGICLYCEKEKILFSGDTLFHGTYGRVDLPYSSEEAMLASLKKLLQLPPETHVYPGHGWSTTIGSEQNIL
ncbi:MAG: MBL fold metallo-hydrolase [bacterium]